ncbi:transmembrane protein [Tieghemostelium lacteum]|uniref:Transmembrane protein n=1 Tax=Tieghemostelium lacteum TaxID=361077 RepID=A0A151ZEV4_TIELA|nr:transmembrane protein [Tieghemostelium lacteum]|eukprot:KYQ92493.1 transmembrane protein [Tieghemostelium lacteum]
MQHLQKKVIKYIILSILVLIVLIALFEDVGYQPVFCSFVSHICYLTLLTEFPFVTLTSLKFIISFITFLISHFSWFFYFRSNWYPFSEIMSVFTFCVWLVPLIFFISLAANDNSLPHSSSSSNRIIGVDSDSFNSKKKSRSSVLKSIGTWLVQKFTEITGKQQVRHYY